MCIHALNAETSVMARLRAQTLVLVVFFVLGAYAVVTQSLLVREFLVVFFGNELSLGLTFFGWLAGVSIGAAVAGRVSRSARARLTAFLLALVLLALLAPVEIVVIRVIRGAFTIGPGEYLSLWTMLWLNPALTVPVSFLIGFAFPLASALLAGEKESQDPITKVYIVEAVGSLVGGALFSFLLIELLPALFLTLLWGMLLLIGAQVLNLPRTWRHPLRSLAVPLGTAVLVVFVLFHAQIDRWSIEKRWDTFHTGTEIVPPSPVDSRYQNITLAESGEQFTVFLNGLAAETFPDPDAPLEAHVAMTQARSIRRVLVIGGGLDGRITEMLTYPPDHLERLDWVLLDPKLLGLVRRHLPEADRTALNDERLHIHHDDGRYFLQQTDVRYNLIVMELPEPSSLLLNRFYTREFFDLVASRLTDDGLFTFTLTAAANVLDETQRKYLGSIWRPLGEVFPERLATWGDTAHIYAARTSGVFTTDREELTLRYTSREASTTRFHPLQVDGGLDRLDAVKLRGRAAELDDAARTATPNTDDRAVSYLYNLILWDRITDESFLAALENVDLTSVLAAAVAVFALWFLAGRFLLRRSLAETATLFSVASTGFATMSVELVLLVVFQSLYGYVYVRVGIVVGVFMLGLVGGSLLMRHVVRKRPGLGVRVLRDFDTAIAVFAFMVPTVFFLLLHLVSCGGGHPWVYEWGIMGLVLLTGLLGGSIFPLAANVMVGEKRHTGRAAGSVDAADHVGACIGALVTGVVLIPAIGITDTCMAVCGLKLLSACFLVFAGPRRAASAPDNA